MNTVPFDKLQKLAGQVAAPTTRQNPPPPPPRQGTSTDRERAQNESWARAALEREVSDLMAIKEGHRNTELNTTGFKMFQLVPHYLSEWEVESRLETVARGLGLPNSEIRSTVRSSKAGMNHARYREAQPGKVFTQQRGRARADSIEREIHRENSEKSELSTGGATFSHLARSADWPAPPDNAAYAGLIGELLEMVEPHTEADPVAIAINFLAAFGSAVGNRPHCIVGATCHPARIFPVLVGKSSLGRKGESQSIARALFERADPIWASNCQHSGVGSGEAIIWAVRDPIMKKEARRSKDAPTTYEEVIEDHGVSDKRLFVQEPELARLLQTSNRQGSTISAVIRDAWDRDTLQTLSRSSAARATGAHIVITGHITPKELGRELTTTDAANGFANRFLWIATTRARFLAEPEPFIGDAVEAIATKLSRALGIAAARDLMERDASAKELWRECYPTLAREQDGLLGSILARAAPQVLRLSLLYALIDGATVISRSHLESALAMWGYCERSAEYIFDGDQTGDPVCDTIYKALQKGEVDRTAITRLFSNHVTAQQIDIALATLEKEGKAKQRQEASGGRPRVIWSAVNTAQA